MLAEEASVRTNTSPPFPKGMSIKPSDIEGLGFFTENGLGVGHFFGFSHVYTEDPLLRQMYPDGWVRSPWSSWYNMNPDVRCARTKHEGDPNNPVPGDYKVLYSTVYIQSGSEITVPGYTLYEVSETSYRPLPDGLALQHGPNGVGIFVTKAFPAGHSFGIMSVRTDNDDMRKMYPSGWVCSPWGSLLCCTSASQGHTCFPVPHDNCTYTELRCVADLAPGDELTIADNLPQIR